ncbi:XrtA system polysaccharide chain length determinant [Wenzhouxiangella sp. EGI_FJ10305]|uniref:XrtA system polysaccharide chain length determinant n=1 Tax=Wenzhouxiangella sp. EGI_FJ10305 TaxID=3243768 RepID=UPI0035DA0A11
MNQLPGSTQPLPLIELIPASLREMQRRLLTLVMLFVVIALISLGIAYSWPKQYHASTTILVSEDNIIRQLMEGRAVATSVYDRAAIAREVVFSRRVMDQTLEAGGWSVSDLDQAERDRLADNIEGRTSIGSPRENLIQIEYWDTEPGRAQKVTASFAERFMAESAEAKRQESREAYEFIAGQVDEYHNRLVDAESRLKQFLETRPDAQPGSGMEVNARVAELRRNLENWQMEQQELRSRMLALQGQLGELGSDTQLDSYQNQLRAQIARLQSELDTQMLDLTPRHPDVVRTRHRIEALREEMAAAGDRIRRGEDSSRTLHSPLHQELGSTQASVSREIAGYDARIRSGEALLANEIERGRRVADSDMELAELSRDHEVNQEIYADLLNRLENARLSMHMDETGNGLTFSIHEPAIEPARPSGLRFLHIAAGGLTAAFAMPLGLILLLVRLDPRVRSPESLERAADLPLLVAMPRYWTDADRRQWWLRVRLSILAVALTLLAFAGAGWMRLTISG